MKREDVLLMLQSKLIQAKYILKDSEEGSIYHFQLKKLVTNLEYTINLLKKEGKE